MMEKKKDNPRSRITITIDTNVWKNLSKLKLNKGFRGFSETVAYLIKTEKQKRGNE